MKNHNVFISEFNDEELEFLQELSTKNSWSKEISLSLIMKIYTLPRKIKSENDIESKIDILSDQIKFSSSLINLNIATSMNDKSILKKIK